MEYLIYRNLHLRHCRPKHIANSLYSHVERIMVLSHWHCFESISPVMALWPRDNIYLMRSIKRHGLRSERVVVCLCEWQNALMVSFLSPLDQFSSSYTEHPQWSPSKICFAKRSPVSCAGKSHKLPVPAFDIILFSVQYVSADFGNCDEFGLLSRLFTPPTSPMRSRPLTQDKSLLCYYFICGGFVAASKQQSMMG